MELFLFARLHALPGNRVAVRQAIQEVQGPTRIEPGCRGFNAFQSVRDQDEFYIHSRWQDMEAFQHHATLPHTVSFIARVESLIDHQLKVTLAEPIEQTSNRD
jgi:quinol monooxygenase YgiN